jgi:uncharacterized protein YecT (DUF1311 family)
VKDIVITAFATLVLLSVCCLAAAPLPATDLCRSKDSNKDVRECYAKEQRRVNVETDTLASKISNKLATEAGKSESDGDSLIANLLKKAAAAVTQSQRTWKDYRDQHCIAVEYSWTSGSGAGTAYEGCMFELGQARLRELRISFSAFN